MARERMPISRAGICSEEGFSFIELSVVLLIIVLFAFFAVPRFAAIVSSNDLEKNAARFCTYLEHIRDEAVFERKILLLKCEIGKGICSVFTSAEEEKSSVLMRPFSFPENIGVADIDIRGKNKMYDGEAEIYFYSGGRADEALFHLHDDKGRALTLEIGFLSRKVKIHEGYAEFD